MRPRLPVALLQLLWRWACWGSQRADLSCVGTWESLEKLNTSRLISQPYLTSPERWYWPAPCRYGVSWDTPHWGSLECAPARGCSGAHVLGLFLASVGEVSLQTKPSLTPENSPTKAEEKEKIVIIKKALTSM